jgi:hypothetical protein
VYQCTVRARTWTFVSRRARVTIVHLPRFDEQMTDIKVCVCVHAHAYRYTAGD